MRINRVLAAALIVVCTVLSGCTSTIAGQATTSGSDSAPANAPRIPDRDEAKVAAALRQMDACAVLDPAAGAQLGFAPGARLLPTGPHSCSFTAAPSLEDKVEVILGIAFGHSARFGAKSLVLNGFKAYTNDTMGSEAAKKDCWVDIPVSFEMSIEFRAEAKYGSNHVPCDITTGFATAAMNKLKNPDALKLSAPRPMANWDSCSLLAQALGDKASTYTLNPASGLDKCGASAKPVNGKIDFKAPKPSLEIGYDSDPMKGALHPTQAGGKPADQSGSAALCRLSVDNGPSGAPDELYAHVVLKVSYGTCDQTSQLATGLVTAMNGQPPSLGEPQSQLLYAAGEPDDPEPGACLDFVGQPGVVCNPYVPTSIPGSTADLLAKADANRNVACAMAKDPMQAAFPDLKPVTWGAHCFFVGPAHTLEIYFDVSAANHPADYGKDPSLYQDRKTSTVSGHPAVSFRASGEYYVYVSPGQDLNQNGIVAGIVKVFPPRGSGDATRKMTVDQATTTAVDQVMAKIVAAYVH